MSSGAVGGPDSGGIGECQGAQFATASLRHSGPWFAPSFAAQVEQLPANAGAGKVRVNLRILLGLQPLADVIDRPALAGPGEFERSLDDRRIHYFPLFPEARPSNNSLPKRVLEVRKRLAPNVPGASLPTQGLCRCPLTGADSQGVSAPVTLHFMRNFNGKGRSWAVSQRGTRLPRGTKNLAI